MAQSVMQNFINQSELKARVSVDSAATHTDEIGSPPYYETQRVLKEQKVPLVAHRAVQVTPADYERYDLILAWMMKICARWGEFFAARIWLR